MKKGIALWAAALLCAACMTPGQKRAKVDAESAISSAAASIAAARQDGADTFAASSIRSADSDLKTAQSRLKSGDWSDANRYARLATSTADEAREEAWAAKKREKSVTAVKPASLKPGSTKKKTQSKPIIAK